MAKYKRCPICERLLIKSEGSPMWIERKLIAEKQLVTLSWQGDEVCRKCEQAQEAEKKRITAAAGTTH